MIKSSSKRKVLVVDDNSSNLKLFKDLLEHNGFKVMAIKDASLAISSYDKFKPDLIIMDLLLNNGFNGYKLVEELRSKKSFYTPIIGSSSQISEEVSEFYTICDAALPKPISVKGLIDAVNNIIKA